MPTLRWESPAPRAHGVFTETSGPLLRARLPDTAGEAANYQKRQKSAKAGSLLPPKPCSLPRQYTVLTTYKF